MERAFTLIELLIVIAIVAILAALLFPVFARAKEAAKGTAGVSNAAQMGKAIVLYGADADDRFPLGAYATDGGRFVVWHDILDPYVRNKEVWFCPGSRVKRTDAAGAPTSHWGYDFRCLTDLRPDFANADGHMAVPATALGSPAETVVLAAARASRASSWCGDDGKFLLPPSGANGDCLGRPDPVILGTVPLVWADTHANRLRPERFYTGQSPPDRFFDLE